MVNNTSSDPKGFPLGISDQDKTPKRLRRNRFNAFIMDSAINNEFGPFVKLIATLLVSNKENDSDEPKIVRWRLVLLLILIGGFIIIGPSMDLAVNIKELFFNE